jgi:hypothetical protein
LNKMRDKEGNIASSTLFSFTKSLY